MADERTDLELLEAVKSKDRRAFDILAVRLMPELNAFLIRMLGNPGDAQDVLQDTLVRVWEKAGQFKGNSSVKTWVFRIGINLAYTQLKRRNRWSFTILEDLKGLVSGDDPVEQVEMEHRSALLEKSLHHLTPRQRSVVVARIYKDLPFAEISEALGCSVNAAKVHFHEGKKRITAYMRSEVGFNG